MVQKILLSIVLFCAVSIVAFFLLIKVIDFNEYKPRIQKAIKESTGYEIVIHGDIALSLSPAGVSISDIEVSNPYYKPEAPFAKLGSFDIALDLSALLKKEVKVSHLSLDNLTLVIEKNSEGNFNYILPKTVKEAASTPKALDSNVTAELDANFPLVNVTKVKFSNANILYKDVNGSDEAAFQKVDLEMNNINYDPTKHQLQGLSFLAKMHIDKIVYDKYFISDISMALEMKDAIAVSENLKYTLFDTPIVGNGKFDFSGKQPKILIKNKIDGLKLSTLSKALFNKDVLDGTANGDIKLSFFVGDALSFKSTINGYIHLSGKDITLTGYDIDKMATLFDAPSSPKNLNTLLAPLEGLQGGKSVLKEVNTNVDVGYSEIQLSDVALSTAKNRAALKGTVNIVDEKFVDVQAALLNAKGCATVQQKISGTFAKPNVKMDESTATTLANVALSFLVKPKKTAPAQTEQVNDENCTVFYEGVVAHPVP